jgi:hypothetical protein
MDLVPTGKTRVMVAQQFSNPLSEGFGGSSIAEENPLETGGEENPLETADPNTLETGDAMDEDMGGKGMNDDVSIQPGEEPQDIPEDNGRKTLTTYVYEKLQNYGYPGRRLQDFKSEFVKESISPEGVKDIQVVIPDKKYPDEKGYTDTIENEELKQISHEVNQMFGLNFNGAERSDGKWTIKFTSADLGDPEEEIAHDSLDQVYGKPDKGGKDKGPGAESKPFKAASTIYEMIKEQKGNIASKLNKMIGDK